MLTVLVIAGTKYVRQHIVNVLMKYKIGNLVLLQANSTEEARRLIVSHKPYFVIIDWLTCQEGLEIARYVKRENLSAKTILVRAAPDLAQMEDIGCCDKVISVSFDWAKFNNAVAGLVEGLASEQYETHTEDSYLE